MSDQSRVTSGGILAVDYGLHRTGLAMCDEERRVAVGAGWLDRISGRTLWRKIKNEADRRKIKTIVIGDPPVGIRGSDKIIEGVDKLVEALCDKGFEVIRWDEEFTTANVLADRRRLGGKSSKPKGWIDEAAAVLILKSYLESKDSQNKKPERSGEV